MKEADTVQTYIIPKISFPVRLFAFAGFAALGAAIQILMGDLGALLGAMLMVPGILFVWAKGYKNKPMDLGFEDWKPATAAEFDRIKTNLLLTRQKRYAVIYRTGFGVFLIVMLSILVFFSLASGIRILTLFLLDATVLLLPFALSGNVRLWTPKELSFKLKSFEWIIGNEPTEGGDIIITPYLRLDKDKEGRQIPEDIRLMVEPRRKPEDFLGVQLQVAINNGPNGPVPYMYAVFLCKGKGASYAGYSAANYGHLIKEPGGDKEYGYVVVRQKTTGTGYHTTDADITNLYGVVKKTLLSRM
jgi:hypothetical protein